MLVKSLLILACATVALAERRVRPEPRQILVDTEAIQARPQLRLSYQSYAIPSAGSGVTYQSYGYPNAYPASSEGGLQVSSPAGTVINVYCSDFNVEPTTGCTKDGMQVALDGSTTMTNVGAYCGSGFVNTTSTGNAATIRFFAGVRTNTITVFKWKCLITAVTKAGASVATTTAAPATTTTAAPATTTRATTVAATTVASATTTVASATTTTTRATTTVAPTAASQTCSCGVRGTNATKIVGGTYAGIREFPWRCALYCDRMGVFCGASIIDNSYIMTAAHCTNALQSTDQLYVDCGDYNLSTTAEAANTLIKVDKISQHQLYNSDTQDNDLSLLHLITPLTYSSSISPVCLPWNNQGNNCETTVTVTASGWGTVSSGGAASSVLKKVDLPCISTTECQKYYGSSVTNNMMCTYSPGTDTCQGDSGGSIDYAGSNGRYYAIGAVSWGVGCAGVDNPGVYAKVTNYLPWIQSTTNANFCKA